MVNQTTIKVEGVRELIKALRQIDGQTPKEIQKFHKRVAQIVVPLAKANAAGRPRKHPGARSKGGRRQPIADTIRAGGSQRGATINAGGARAPDIFVQEFGGTVPLFGDRSRRVLVRPVARDGHFLYPAIRAKRDTISRIYLDGLEQTLRRYWGS